MALAVLAAVVLTGCGIGGAGSGDGFAAGDEFSYMAEVTEAEDGATRFGLIAGTVASNGTITGERRLVDVRDGAMQNDTTEFTGEAHEDGTATFHGIGPDGGDVTAALEDSKSIMTTDQEPGIAATSWNRASLPAFNNAIQDAVRG
ncbi:hypothetical protein [Myceligenerans pegani]|uniref:Lipoprotein n=1 Tax=Myceligenerans pegani TaxID=2776917 RepID=A0ABR9MUV6_9MICO|nr:hypothetical protein [Myceligenerans sp. TRM 65318]MBE1874719.1 hypothetical protein [Myceligenerans sp. TRM 65318]MBE3016990.1 hypothetical protein [Myceligenerans sp. TRM 65318]